MGGGNRGIDTISPPRRGAYRQARRGDVAVADASRLATILAAMRQCLEASELERRIGDMEAALAPERPTPSIVTFRSRR